MTFKDQFKSEDQQKALMYRAAFETHMKDSIAFMEKGELDTSQQIFDQGMLLLGELRTMALQHESNEKMMTDHAMEVRRNW